MRRKPIEKELFKKMMIVRADYTIHDMQYATKLGYSTISMAYSSKKATQDVQDKFRTFCENPVHAPSPTQVPDLVPHL